MQAGKHAETEVGGGASAAEPAQCLEVPVFQSPDPGAHIETNGVV